MPRPARPWFRFYVEAIAADRKIRRLDVRYRWLWVAVLGIARQSPIPGRLLVGEDAPYEVEDVADFAAMTLREVRAGMAELERVGLVVLEDGCWVVPKWAERQFEGDYSREGISDETRAAVLLRDNSTCRECSATDDLQIDHIIPVTKGGTCELDNLQVLCGRCNRRKGNRLRQQRHRESQRNAETALPKRDSDAAVTPPDTEADTETETPPSPLLDQIVELVFERTVADKQRRGERITSVSGLRTYWDEHDGQGCRKRAAYILENYPGMSLTQYADATRSPAIPQWASPYLKRNSEAVA